MADRLVIRLYKGESTADFRSHAERAAPALGGRLRWGTAGTGRDDFRFHSDGLHHAIYLPYQGSDFTYCLELGRQSGLPWIELRIQEGSLWDYTLYRGAEVADNFSPWPECWEDPDEPGFDAFKAKCRGNPEVLANLWAVPVERISRYVMQWGHITDPEDEDLVTHTLTGKAYPTDRFTYGSYQQFYDVLAALGGQEPFMDYEQHSLLLPKPGSC